MVENRKMHIVWTAILYMILISISIIFMPAIMDLSSIKETIKNEQKLIEYTLIYTFSTILLMFVGFLYITRFILHTAYIVSIAAGMIFGIVQILNGEIMRIMLGGLCIIISLMALMSYLMSTRYRIDKTAIILKTTTILVWENIFVIGLLIITTCVPYLLLAAIFIAFSVEHYDTTMGFIISLPLMFIFIWSIHNLFYTYVVFIGSILSIQIFSNRMSHNVFVKAIRNVYLYSALICYGGFFIAKSIICIFHYRTTDQEITIRRSNKLSFPYMIIKGTSYSESVCASKRILANYNLSNTIDYIIIERVLIVSTIFSNIIYFLIGYILGHSKFDSFADSICMFCPLMLFLVCSAFIAAYRTLLTIYTLDREALNRTLPEIAETFENINTLIQNRN